MGKKEKNDNKKNVVVLTIIAIATMLVVVISATFAYLAAAVQTTGSQNVNVTTNGTNDILLIDAGGDISISASETNFGVNNTDVSNETYSTVTLQTSNTSAVTYNYKVFFDASGDGSGANDFEYTSGTCYVKTTASTSGETTESACKTAGKLWAKVGDADYACYTTTSTKASTSFQESSSLCTAKADNMWVQDKVTELALDVYKGDDTISSTDCATTNNGGICVDQYRSVQSSITSKTNCEKTSTNRWIANVYNDGVCYKIDKTFDITDLKSTKDIYFDDPDTQQYDGETISATNTTKINYYMARVTFVNLGHNQIENGNKNLTGHIKFEVQSQK